MAVNWKQEYSHYRRILMRMVNEYKGREDVRLFTELLLSLGTIVIFGAFAIRPTLITITELLVERKTKQETLQKLDQKIINLQKAQKLYDDNFDQFDKLDIAIPKAPEPDSYLRQIEGLALKYGLEITKLSTGDVALLGASSEAPVEENTKAYLFPNEAKNIEITINLTTGEYTNLSSFLSDFEKLTRPMLIDTSSVLSTNQQGEQLLILSIIGRVPYING